ncbi:hypothetical protein [Halorussus halophilus]|uniref:hypothetical protein n=1 Tax=Halorussus halophilus TaxID=2650975 RepID=UPI0013019650|nr:hypothetical protein [Halorussus halophilus]
MSLADSISKEVTAESYQPTNEDFQAALEELLRAADSHDVELERAYDFRTDGNQPDWMVDISRLKKRR